MVWDHLPKPTFVLLTQLGIGVYDTVANFNIRERASIDILKQLDMEPGFHMIAGCKGLNNERIRKAIRMNPDKKLSWQILCAKKLNKNNKKIEKEGDLYVPGGF